MRIWGKDKRGGEPCTHVVRTDRFYWDFGAEMKEKKYQGPDYQENENSLICVSEMQSNVCIKAPCNVSEL